ncbi:MAG: trypsin-like peptidase domain-containing protein [Cyclobacteriaceae bacterium]|nr:trypsin-like peptidase domain-containing protein [Cyclobacteriaceae bacterium]UYN87881.1 MAG: trypsin-like peptidase domain-containing protein [Cyclobacteriaceae bacterium]
MKSFLKIIIVGFVGGLAGAYTMFNYLVKSSEDLSKQQPAFSTTSYDSPALVSPNLVDADAMGSLELVDFSAAANKAIPSVVYINSIFKGTSYSAFDWFFGGGATTQTRVSSGSGVIFTKDGYIVTNNHVVEAAEKIEVMLNKKVYPAELIGTDPSTDLAVLKINETNLPAITIGSSKNVQVGEWVLAVGNPFSLSSTVTAGIVSAKGRRIGILEDKFPIESFIQTDAAINPGNSGGALVNKNGELVGINTAILSRTGSYTGYAFAVPVDIAYKVFEDLVKYGVVQKALFGGNVVEYNFQNAKKYDLNTNVSSFEGVLVESLDKEGPAFTAGLKPGDVITRIDGKAINSQSAFEEELAYRYPGDVITVSYQRDKKTNSATIKLVNKSGTTEIVKRKIFVSSSIGAEFEATDYGVKVFKINDRSVLKQIGIPENFTIIAINRVKVKEPQEVIEFFEKFKGRGYVYGLNSSRQQVEIPFIIR